MSAQKFKVVWICHFSDAKTRASIRFDKLYYKRLIYLILNKKYTHSDYAVWVTNAIREFEKYGDVDLTIIFPHAGIKGRVQKFDICGIHYICFRSEDDNFISFAKNRYWGKRFGHYKHNRKTIVKEIRLINPEIVHLIGAENPYYSLSVLDVDSAKTIVSLQTLMSDPEFIKNYPISREEWEYRSKIETDIIRQCSYIATPEQRYRDIIIATINPNAHFLNLMLALGQPFLIDEVKKEYDFVYFAADISKAADYAIEAFIVAAKKEPNITLNISGYYSVDFKTKLEERLALFGLKNSVYFTGPKDSHEEVLKQIKKSRFALLPLKVDLISGTIREAMACGIPVVTTITPATPKLNDTRESVLLSEKGDFEAMACNMLQLMRNEDYAETIKENALITVSENYDNVGAMEKWRTEYYNIINNKSIK